MSGDCFKYFLHYIHMKYITRIDGRPERIVSLLIPFIHYSVSCMHVDITVYSALVLVFSIPDVSCSCPIQPCIIYLVHLCYPDWRLTGIVASPVHPSRRSSGRSRVVVEHASRERCLTCPVLLLHLPNITAGHVSRGGAVVRPIACSMDTVMLESCFFLPKVCFVNLLFAYISYKKMYFIFILCLYLGKFQEYIYIYIQKQFFRLITDHLQLFILQYF